jgi:uncharacterized protein (DUF1810 family)
VTDASDPGDTSDPYDLNRFVQAQQLDYDEALLEIRRGRNTSHWMWYVFPQVDGLGSSATSSFYSIKSLAEGAAYVAHPILGPRLAERAEAVPAVEVRSADEIFGSPDDLKLRSCATLFVYVSLPGSVFHRILDKVFQGKHDRKTLGLLGIAPEDN